METYDADHVSPDQSFLEMLDEVNEVLVKEGKDPIAFDHDCREGICGMCSQVINGMAHGGQDRTTVCQLHMRSFSDGDEIFIEPWKARAFPIIKDLAVDRGNYDRIIQAGGYTSCHTGGVSDGNALLIGKVEADYAMDAAECIGCGACAASCPNSSAMLFTGAKVAQLAVLPQGRWKPKSASTPCSKKPRPAVSATAPTTTSARRRARRGSTSSSSPSSTASTSRLCFPKAATR